MTLQVVAGVQSREFALSALDFKIECARVTRNRHRATADKAVADGAPIVEQHALACAQANSDALNWLLERRHRLTSEAL